MQTLQQFFLDVLPPSGHYCITQLPSGKHHWSSSLEALTTAAHKVLHLSGLYFGTAAYATTSNRKQANVLSLKSLRLDIDAGEEKYSKHGDAVYPTHQDALHALVAFSKTCKLPPTYIVSSGHGLHIYYCLDASTDTTTWKRLAQALAQRCSDHGLRVDNAVTCDSARILRIPGSPHHSGNLVTILRRLEKFYTVAELENVLNCAQRNFDTSINADIQLDSSAYNGPPRSALLAAQHCAALREVAQSQGCVPEPFWRAMIGIVKHSAEGRDIAHEWSQGHDEYSAQATDRKFDAWGAGPTTCNEFTRHTDACASCPWRGRVKTPLTLGLPTADEKERYEPPAPGPAPKAEATEASHCPTQEGATPPADEPPPWEGNLPNGYSVERSKSGAFMLTAAEATRRETPTGESVPAIDYIPFTPNIFWFGQWAAADGSEDTAHTTLHLWEDGRVKRYLMDQSIIASPSKLLEFLSGKAIHTTSHKKATSAMQNYVKAQMHLTHADGRSQRITDRLGLRTLDDGQLICTHGPHIIYPDGTVREAMLGNSLRALATSFRIPLPNDGREVYSSSVWANHIMPRAQRYVSFLQKFYGAGQERMQLALMLGIASPLMAFVTGEYMGGADLPSNSSLTVSLFSRSSARGKTTVAKLALLAYGNPSKLTSDSGKAGASTNARIGTLSMHGTLPSVMDEVSDLTPTEVATVISSVANGTGKRTMTQVRSLRQEATWALINLVTTNTSQRELVAASRATAAPVLYRMLEIDVDNLPEYSVEQRIAYRDEMAELSRDCAGALGAVLHRELCRLGASAVSKLTLTSVAKAEQILGAEQTDRFQSRGLGALIACHLVLRSLGLGIFDLAELVATFKHTYEANKDFIFDSGMPESAAGQLSRALADMASQTIVTQELPSGPRSHCRLLNSRMPDTIAARHAKNDGITWLSVQALKAWCTEHGIGEAGLVREAVKMELIEPSEWKSNGKVQSRRSRPRTLTAGLEVDMGLRTNVYTINVRKLNAIVSMGNEDLRVITNVASQGGEGGSEEPQAANG